MVKGFYKLKQEKEIYEVEADRGNNRESDENVYVHGVYILNVFWMSDYTIEGVFIGKFYSPKW